MKRLACLAALAASFQVLDASAVELSRFRTMHDTDWTQVGLGGMRGVGEGASNVGFTLTPEGRAYLAAQWERSGGALTLIVRMHPAWVAAFE